MAGSLAPSEHIRVLALTKYGRRAASSRYRFLNYIPLLAERGVLVTPVPLLSDGYVERLFAGRRAPLADLARSFLRRVSAVSSLYRFDLLWIEGELFPRFPALAERLLGALKFPYVVDLDDAIFHTYDRHPHIFFRKVLGRKIDVVLSGAAAVTAGNQYLAERAVRTKAQRVVIVPTAVDDRAYAGIERFDRDTLTFGWIGSPGTAQYLKTVQAELDRLCRSLPAKARLIGIAPGGCASPDIIFRPWNEETEIEELALCDIGIAPLFDGPWERGKCGLKAIQYMASGIPVLAANVGVSPSLVVHGETGFLYRDGAEFTAFARQLASDRQLRRKMGAAGRRRVASSYSVHGWVEVVRDLLVSCARRRSGV